MVKQRFVPPKGKVPSDSVVEMRLGARLWQELISSAGRAWWSRLQGLSHQLSQAYGVPLPTIDLSLDGQLPENVYQFRLASGAPDGGVLYPGRWFAAGEAEVVELLMGEHGHEPVFGLEGRWIPHSRGQGAEQLGCHLLSPEALWVGHLSDRIERRLDLCLCPEWLKLELKRRGLASPGSGLFQQLIWLLEERVSVASLPLIIEAYRSVARGPAQRLRAIRRTLGPRVLAPWLESHGRLATLTLTDSVSRRLRRELACESGPDNWFLGLLLGQLQNELHWAQQQFGEAVIVVAGDLRRSLFELLRFELRRTPVLAYDEIPPDVELLSAAVVGSRLHPLADSWTCRRWNIHSA